jgi:hypothetical protein
MIIGVVARIVDGRNASSAKVVVPISDAVLSDQKYLVFVKEIIPQRRQRDGSD